ncbi:serine protease inhibitor dipetalogastin-like [Leguminivora glycinivorella]|uniref:serine protease inhibitor dipetalogastin-like n=1 Tax=Leguminivora glycinivorella TaxID=1035111 RepID=UPI00200CC540|nr:serine protease inhibitor dipetalogastin-like [Leguminivora glycinivorella]
MKRILFFVCISSLVAPFYITSGLKLSLRQGPEESTPPGTGLPLDQEEEAAKKAIPFLKNCTMCPRHYKPVCANNGQWYINPCFMACAVGSDSSVGILYEGVCRPEHMKTSSTTTTTTTPHHTTTEEPKFACAKKCEEEDAPVCGSNGEMYGNACLMKCDEVEPADNETVCTATRRPAAPEEHYSSACTCSKVYDPVCVVDGNWYWNLCMKECMIGKGESSRVLYQGKCVNFLL